MAFRSCDADALRTARRSLTAGIKRAKADYTTKIQRHFTSNDPRSMWWGIKCITDYNRKNVECPSDPSLPDALNSFYARFEATNNTTATRLISVPDDLPPSVTATEVRFTLQKINPRKAAGPDGIPGHVLRDCACQLSEVMCDTFNTSLSQAIVPSCLKTSTIVPSSVSCLNDYHPIALTPIIMKSFEKLISTRIKKSINITSDSHQYAYRQNRSTADALSAVLHQALTHVENRDTYVSWTSVPLSTQ